MAKTNPEMIINEIQDIYLRRNFLQLDNYFKSQNQLLDFKFFEVKFTATTLNQKINHGLKFIPRDVVFLGVTNNATVSFNVGLFDLTTLDITANKETVLRFFIGKYFNSAAITQFEKTDVLVFGPDSLDSTTTTKIPTITKLTTGSGVYIPPAGTKYIMVKMVGGGGSGGTAGPAGLAGAATTFGTLIADGGGLGGQANLRSGLGGSGTVGSGFVGSVYAGNSGSKGDNDGAGGHGGGSAIFGGGGNSFFRTTGGSGQANTGGGGAGGGGAVGISAGYGAGGGGGIIAYSTTLSSFYAYSIGAGGAVVTAVQGNGGAGGTGYIEITEFYQ